ncbi:MAG: B12-binding domain-containing radical SAM protein [Candidatus Woesearchaeota archaeon]
MKILLIYPPFCPPTIMPYSISYLKAFIETNTDIHAKALDLNVRFHQRFQSLENILPVYTSNNKQILNNQDPEGFDELKELVRKENPDLLAFSLVYSSQVFYAKALIEALNIPAVQGGPAASSHINARIIPDELKLLEYLGKNATRFIVQPDFSDLHPQEYFSPEPIYPVKTSHGCYYKMCAFCTHHKDESYMEIPIQLPEGKNFFFIDDMIPPKRLIEIADQMPKNARWWAQLRPAKDLIPILPKLAGSGLKSIAWGVESGCQKMLNRMQKGTQVQDIKQVLATAKKEGIINTVYIIFGFPGETEEDFHETIKFLKENSENIDLISTSMFGLQKGSKVYNNPEAFGIEIRSETRTLLDDKITYTPDPGNIRELRKKYKKTIENLNKYPKYYNLYKDQTLFL